MGQEHGNSILILEAALLCSPAPMTLGKLQDLFAGALSGIQIQDLLTCLQQQWHGRGLELIHVANGWRFQSREFVREALLRLDPEPAPRYSRATMETLAIIAWRQPVTRSDIEAIRGVTVSPQIIQSLHERGWIELTSSPA